MIQTGYRHFFHTLEKDVKPPAILLLSLLLVMSTGTDGVPSPETIVEGIGASAEIDYAAMLGGSDATGRTKR